MFTKNMILAFSSEDAYTVDTMWKNLERYSNDLLKGKNYKDLSSVDLQALKEIHWGLVNDTNVYSDPNLMGLNAVAVRESEESIRPFLKSNAYMKAYINSNVNKYTGITLFEFLSLTEADALTIIELCNTQIKLESDLMKKEQNKYQGLHNESF